MYWRKLSFDNGDLTLDNMCKFMGSPKHIEWTKPYFLKFTNDEMMLGRANIGSQTEVLEKLIRLISWYSNDKITSQWRRKLEENDIKPCPTYTHIK